MVSFISLSLFATVTRYQSSVNARLQAFSLTTTLPPLVLSLAFRPRIHCEQSLQSTENPSPLHAQFIISTILSSVLSVPYTHASFCTLSFPGAFLYFRFLISLSTSSTVISVPSGAVYFLFVSVSAFATTFLSSAIS
jgi:hypothetical protein